MDGMNSTLTCQVDKLTRGATRKWDVQFRCTEPDPAATIQFVFRKDSGELVVEKSAFLEILKAPTGASSLSR